ncbi:MAG: hypothetical protein ACI4S0_00325 [Dorea sp.]
MITLFSVLKIITTIFLVYAAYYFLRATFNSNSNADLVGNGFSLTFMVLAVMFMWI